MKAAKVQFFNDQNLVFYEATGKKAQLYCAAPKLLAALENLIAACTHADPACREATANRVVATRIARQVIESAKGE